MPFPLKKGENLLTAIVEMIGIAIDENRHTAGHCYRVTEDDDARRCRHQRRNGRYADFNSL
ncbi:MAG: hypothetical protein ACNYPH_04855 [Gammaproteobacteria bacterium WSBS_2016_MAG_OTU1]